MATTGTQDLNVFPTDPLGSGLEANLEGSAAPTGSSSLPLSTPLPLPSSGCAELHTVARAGPQLAPEAGPLLCAAG